MEMKTSESIAELAKALASFQSEVKQPEKDGVNPHFKSRYVTLDNTVKAIHEFAPKHGLSFIQMPVNSENGVGVITVIFHSSGQFIEFEPFVLPLDKKTAQGVGSALTYSKRYALSSAFGLVSDEDDDGNVAEEYAPKKQSNKQQLATDKQMNLINKLLADVANHTGSTKDKTYKALSAKMKKDMEWYSPADASQAIEILNTALKQTV
jgi:hypothetical protein